MSILVATDFSPCSRTAVRLAAALAKRRGVPLFLMHSLEPAPAELPAGPVGATGWEMNLVTGAEQAIAHEATSIRETGVAVESHVFLGSAAAVILEAARERGADLIVLGTHGRKGGAHFFLGSVAETVVRSSTCAVLVARDAVRQTARWEGRGPLRLTLGTDASSASRAAFSWAGNFAKSQACDLSIVRIYVPLDEAIRYGLDDLWGGPVHEAELLPLLERDLRHEAQTLLGEVPAHLRFRAAGHEASDVLSMEAAMLGADAIVIGIPRRRSMRGATLAPAHVLRSSTLPVLCIPETMAASPREIPQVRSVLVAVDLSDASKAVIPAAYRLLRAGGGRVELCTVYEVNPAGALAEMPLHPPLTEERRTAMAAQLRVLIPPDADSFDIATGISVVEGRFAAETILATAQRLGVDVIAIGSHGRSGFKRALLGSVAETVARRAACPVLIIRSAQAPAH